MGEQILRKKSVKLKMASYAAAEYSDDSNDFSDVEDEDSEMSDGEGSPNHHRQRAEFTEMKEQMYQDKLADLKRQLAKLNDGTLPEWQKKLRKLDTAYRERVSIMMLLKTLKLKWLSKSFCGRKNQPFENLRTKRSTSKTSWLQNWKKSKS